MIDLKAKKDKVILAVTAAISIAVIVAVFLYIFSTDTSKEAAPTKQQPVTVEQPIESPASSNELDSDDEIPEPSALDSGLDSAAKHDYVMAPISLENSNTQVLLAVADFAPQLAQWLIPDEQIRKWVLAIDLMADGKLPRRYRPLDYPMAKFIIQSNNDQTVASDENHSRMNEIINTLTATDPTILAEYYRQWLPLLEKAYQEQGKPGNFDQRFRQTISQVLAAEPLATNPDLVRPSVLYKYADENLEQANDIDKLIWRMGPENTDKVQNFLRELRYQLDK